MSRTASSSARIVVVALGVLVALGTTFVTLAAHAGQRPEEKEIVSKLKTIGTVDLDKDGYVKAVFLSPLFVPEPEMIESLDFSKLTRLKSISVLVFSASKDADRLLNQVAKTAGPLDILMLTSPDATDAAVANLLSKQRSLGVLDIVMTRIAAKSLREISKMSDLRHLTIAGTSLPDADIAPLRLGQLKKLNSLSLSQTGISDGKIAQLGLDQLKKLISLDLAGTGISDAGLRPIADLPELMFLTLDRTKVTGAGIFELRRLQDFRILGIRATKVDDAGVRALQECLPQLRIEK